jgi:uncharacterized protein (DUF1501 family)
MIRAQGFVTGNGDDRQTLVVIFLRGGADGLSLVPPLADDDYHRARPRLGVSERDGLRLDDVFGLHPRLAALHPLFTDGSLAIVHGAGSEDTTRSHFEAQDLMEHGGVAAGGWLGRFLRYRGGRPPGALSAVVVGTELPESLRGAPSAAVLRSLDDFALGGEAEPFVRALGQLYGARRDALGAAGRDTLDAVRRIDALRTSPYAPARGAEYPDDDFGRALVQVARLIKAQVGLEAASVDLGGWDSHFTQSAIVEPLMTRLATGLAAFARDLGPAMRTTTVVVMTEFGRRVVENASFGTDHGRGSTMFVLGGGVRGGRVLGAWRGLGADVLEGPGDVPVTVNYRNVLAPILAHHGPLSVLDRIFPAFAIQPIDLY